MGITDKYSLGFFLPIFIVPAIKRPKILCIGIMQSQLNS